LGELAVCFGSILLKKSKRNIWERLARKKRREMAMAAFLNEISDQGISIRAIAVLLFISEG